VETAIICAVIMTNPDPVILLNVDLPDATAKIATTGYGPFLQNCCSVSKNT
jgi:hypothetical protein